MRFSILAVALFISPLCCFGQDPLLVTLDDGTVVELRGVPKGVTISGRVVSRPAAKKEKTVGPSDAAKRSAQELAALTYANSFEQVTVTLTNWEVANPKPVTFERKRWILYEADCTIKYESGGVRIHRFDCYISGDQVRDNETQDFLQSGDALRKRLGQ